MVDNCAGVMYENIYKQCRVEVDKEIIDKPVGLGTKKRFAGH